MVTKMSKPSPCNTITDLPVCFTHETLQAISQELFNAGNPKYVWIDLVDDGYVNASDGIGYYVYFRTNKIEEGGNLKIPADVQMKYIDKWLAFLQNIKEPITKSGEYNLQLHNGILCNDITNKESKIWQISKQELTTLDLNIRGELRFKEELVKDKLADPNEPLKLNFGKEGFYIDGKRLSAEQKEKYYTLCKEEFGWGYSIGRFSWTISPDMNTIALGKEIAIMKEQIAFAEAMRR